MEMKIDREWSTFLKIFEKFFLHRVTGVNRISVFALTGRLLFCTG